MDFLVNSIESNFYKIINRNIFQGHSSMPFSGVKKDNIQICKIFGLIILLSSIIILTHVLNNLENDVYGQVGSYLTVTGSEYKDVRDSETLHLKKFSLGGWFKTDYNFSENGFIVNKGGAGLESKGMNLNYGIWIAKDETIKAGFETETGQNYVVSSEKKYNDNQWHNVFVTFDGKKLKLYMDGKIISEAIAEANPDSTGIQPVRIGANSFNVSKFFVGNIDEIRLWNKTLTDNEINEGYFFNKFNIKDQVLYVSFNSEKIPVQMNMPVQRQQSTMSKDYLSEQKQGLDAIQELTTLWAKPNNQLTSQKQEDFDTSQFRNFAEPECKKLSISDVDANGALSQYPAKNVKDGKLDTRWSHLGMGSYVTLDLGKKKQVCNVDIAWYRGDERKMTFTISTSTDGKSFKNVYSGTTSGNTELFENYDFKNENARYVKVTVTKNTMNDWASISEIKVNGLSELTSPPPAEEFGKLEVVNNVINDNGGKKIASDFAVHVTGNNPNPQSFSGSSTGVLVNLGKGEYYVETQMDGYDTLYTTDCFGSISANQNKKCTIISNDIGSQTPPPVEKTGTVKVITKVINDDSGTNVPSDFTILVTGNNPNPKAFSGSSEGTFVTLGEGSYQVETEMDSYDTTYSIDCSGTISANEIKTCTITNNDIGTQTPPPVGKTGTLKVVTNVINDDSGTNVPSDFTILVTGNNPDPKSFTGSTNGVLVTLGDGSYYVESNKDGYDTTYSIDCSGTISANEIKTCTITNNDIGTQTPPPVEKTGTLEVVTNVINDDTGTNVPSDFTILVNGNNPNPKAFSGSPDGIFVTLGEGSYQVEENASQIASMTDGYDTTYSPDCSGTISANEIKTCTITNNDASPQTPPKEQLGTLEVITKVINNDTGTNVPSDFSILVTGNNPNPESFSGSSNGIFVTLGEGSYQVETEMDGYDTTYSPECSGSISANDIKICTITNNDIAPQTPPKEQLGTLEVITKVINDNGGTNIPSDFTVSITGNNPNPESFSGSSDGIFVTLGEGSYQVESEMDGYDTTYSPECSGSISANDEKICTIINDDVGSQTPPPPGGGDYGILKVITKVINDNGGTSIPSDFTVQVTGNNPNPESFSGSSNGIFVTLGEGSYQVESDKDGYDTAYSTDCSGSISANDEKICTIITDDVGSQTPTPPPTNSDHTIDEFGTEIPFKLTGRYVDLEMGTDHRNGQRFSVNHHFENYIGIGYLLTGQGQELVENKHDGPNHSGRTDEKNTADTWTEPAFHINDGQARIGSEHPHPVNGPEIIPQGAIKIGNLDKKWIGYGSYGYKSKEGFRVIGLLGTNDPFDANGKPKNNWNLGFHLVDKGQICDSGQPNKGCELRQEPPAGNPDGAEYEIRMHHATNHDTAFKWFRIYEIVNPNTDEPPIL